FSALSGLMDRMTVIYLGQIFIEGEILLSIKVLIRGLSAFVLFLHRKWHRCRTMILLLAIALLTMSIRLVAIRKEVSTCSIRPRVKEEQMAFGLATIFVFYLSVEMLRVISLLFVAELTPSALRMSMVTLVTFVNSMSREFSTVWTTEDTFKTTLMCLAVFVVACLMLKRRVTDAPEIFCIYLNDLVPKPKGKKEDDDDDEDELDRKDYELDK
ncbi:hypothetical protein PFISCL1PPCAC_5427, partial [Pristionchus fissidentatus]